jgi:hypothetical protein
MWECPKCRERHQDSFDVCWNCGTSRDGTGDPTFARADEAGKIPDAAAADARIASRSDAESITAARPHSRASRLARTRTAEQLIYVGLNGYALALDRDTGEIVWSNNEMRSGYVSLLLDGDRLIVSTNGYIYCLDP